MAEGTMVGLLPQPSLTLRIRLRGVARRMENSGSSISRTALMPRSWTTPYVFLLFADNDLVLLNILQVVQCGNQYYAVAVQPIPKGLYHAK